ncbi:MAG: hypothetical protein MK100_08775 [Phycisphaerales bacterium]|nr:hypothetical protein [Phycisphaerales bacterium]
MHNWRRISGLSAVLIIASSVHAQIRVVQWNLAEMRGDPDAIAEVIEALDQDDKPGFARDVTILTVQEADTATYTHLLKSLGPEWTAATYTNSGEDNYGGAQACFYHAQTVTEIPSGHDGTYTEAGRRARRWLFALNGYDDPQVTFYVYSAHLKAGTSSGSIADRDIGAGRILTNMGEVPADSYIIVTGDMNFYSNGEPGYQTFIDGGLIDPLGTGSWAGEGNAIKHTQSPRTIQAGGLASGGMDDRFDLQLFTPNIIGSGGLTLIDNSYRSVGNDGQHYNIAINDGSNNYWPGDVSGSNALADALHDASDHLPVAADFRAPAILNASFNGCDIGSMIEGYDHACQLDLGNAAISAYDASLNWTMTGTGVLSGNSDSGTVSPGSSTDLTIVVDSSMIGAFADTLEVASDDMLTQHAPALLELSGQVLRHANPSFSNTADNDFYVHFIDVECDTGVVPLGIQFWNYQWDENQARLDVDGISTPEEPVSFLGGTWNNVGPFPISMPFEIDTNGLPAGNYVRLVTITVSDEDLPGESSVTMNLTLNITAIDTVPDCQGDVDGDGQTDIADLLALLAGYGGSDPALDLVEDGIIDVSDLLALLGDYGCN